MILNKEEIQKLAAEIRQKLSAAPSVSIRGNINRTVMGGKGGGASVNLAPGVSNPTGMQMNSQPKSPLAGGAGNGKNPSKT